MTKKNTPKYKNYLLCSIAIFILAIQSVSAQHKLRASMNVISENRVIHVNQELDFVNPSTDTLKSIYLLDWNNAFSSKISPLGKRFSEDYNRRFRFSSLDERGFTEVNSITQKNKNLNFERLPKQVDIIKLKLTQPLKPGETSKLKLNYDLHIPLDKFTDYGFNNGNYKLRHHLILPAVYRQSWEFYSHKDINDQFVPEMDVELNLKIPLEYSVVSAMRQKEIERGKTQKIVQLTGKNSFKNELLLLKDNFFERYQLDSLNLLTNILDENLDEETKKNKLNQITGFLREHLGPYPDSTLLASEVNYLNDPVYGLNQLPDLIRPFSDEFQYEVKMFKVMTSIYLENSFYLNPRKELWAQDAIQVYLMMRYVEKYHPKTKLFGKLTEIIGLRWFHAADLEYNYRYPFLFLNMARLNLDQPLTKSQDSLVKFNQTIANSFKAGIGLAYLNDYLENNAVDESIAEFFKRFRLKTVHPSDFEAILKERADKKIDWFFKDYVAGNSHIDFDITEVEKTEDSIRVHINNKENNRMPVSLYGITDKQIVFKTWTKPFKDDTVVSIPKINAERLALNYEGVIPEFNQRNNYYGLNAIFNKPFQIRLFQDIEDPRYNQVFVMPEFSYNLYDGISIGPTLYNKTLLSKTMIFSISPKYGFTSKTLIGSASFYKTHQFQNQAFHAIRYGISGTRYSYADDLFYRKYSPYVTFAFRDTDLRNNEDQYINFRSVTVDRDRSSEDQVDEPDYSVFSANYSYSNRNLVNYFTGKFDIQFADKFNKISVSSKYRKLYLDNRQIELRFFGGLFLRNDSRDSDYFSFALDRPTDYLFDYNYYGRSESSGLFSQQYIEAEGGFKSQLEPAFANQWLTTVNGSVTIWNWIYAYSDIGFVKNKGQDAKFLYDSGIRVSLVQDYFEVFFPVYSSLGWEIDQPDYDQKIRFIVSLDFGTLVSLFTREYY
jgi:hypothetical protein